MSISFWHNFKFGKEIGRGGGGVLVKKYKIRSKGVAKGSRDLLLEFWDKLVSKSVWLCYSTDNIFIQMMPRTPY